MHAFFLIIKSYSDEVCNSLMQEWSFSRLRGDSWEDLVKKASLTQ